MRKLYFLFLLSIVFSFSSRSQYVTIPDANLKTQLQQMYPSCFNAAGLMDTTCSQITTNQYFYLSASGILDYTGIQYFDALQVFRLSSPATIPPVSLVPATVREFTIDNSNALTTLPALPGWLTKLTISNCSYLTSIPAFPPALLQLECSSNPHLTTLPVLPATLINLNCVEDNLSGLPALPTGLQSLLCPFNASLTTLPALPSSLRQLDCQQCSITSLGTTLPSSLVSLDFSDNQITYLPPLPSGITYLSGTTNLLTSLPAFPASLQTISVDHNQVTSIPALPAGLTNLSTSYNPIGVLPTLPNGLLYLQCNANQLTVLPALPATLERLWCSVNQLTALPVLPATAMTDLSCDQNLLTSLPQLPNSLGTLACRHNLLTSLPILPPNLEELHCEYNQIGFLPAFPQSLSWIDLRSNPVRCLPVLPNQIDMMTMDNRIGCMPNLPSDYYFFTYDTLTGLSHNYNSGSSQSQYRFPLCSVTNNVYHCTAFPVMQGYVYNDNNNNNVRDANEPYRANIKVSLSNGYFTSTDNNGFYQIVANNIGAYTLTCTPPNYFASAPPAYNYNLSSYDTLLVNNFGLKATAVVDSVSISVAPLFIGARISRPMPYVVTYENSGTTTLTPIVVFNYPNSQLIYDSSSNIAVTNNGFNLQLNSSPMVAGERRTFTAYFHVSNSAVLNDSVHVIATINANNASNADTAVSQVRSAYDPNDKFATPILPPDQVAAGKYIDYTIRFQNTGNDTAFNVVITDTLSSFLQPQTFKMVSSSHPCKATVNGNAVSFEFLNIQLPDSNVNELKSHGYVSFKIKPQSNVVLNTNIPNKSNIYFDYNLPVLTNTAITQITNFSTVPLKLLSFRVEAKTKNTANAYWSTFNEYNLQDYTIEYSVDGRNYIAVAAELPKAQQYNNYVKEVPVPAARVVYYRLKITDTDGRSYYGPVVALKINITSAGFSFMNNPVKDVLTISITDAALLNTTARIINAQGAVVQRIYLKNETEKINISQLPAGNYILETVQGSSAFVVIK